MTESSKAREAAPLLPAATVLLLRDNPATDPSLEVFMVVRNYEIDAFSGALIFPGGKVSEGDHAGLDEAICSTHNLSDEMVPFYVSAIRECFEECGILLARDRDTGELVSGERLTALRPYGPRLDRNEISMAEFLKAENLQLAIDELVHFAHWITPPLMPKRFDTHFLLARAPKDQVAIHDGHEAISSVWINPGQALAEQKQGKRTIIFPTRCNLDKLAESGSTITALERARISKIVTVLPWLGEGEDAGFLCIPKEAGYRTTREPLENMRN